MTIPFRCPHCGAQTNVDEEFAGRSGPCFQCGQTVTVPSLSGMPNVGSPVNPYMAAAPPARKSNKLVWVIVISALGALVLFCVIGMLIALLLPAVQAAREAARRSTCRNNLKHIGLAMHLYAEDHGCLPPPYLADEDGTPMHSWRVLLLPYLERRDLYDRYDFNEPWNGPNNRLLAAEMPEVYGCASAEDYNEATKTPYVAIVGDGLIFDPNNTVRFDDITDAISNTIAVVESTGPNGNSVEWMSPEDLSVNVLNPAVNGIPGPAIASFHAGGANVLFADGSVYFLREETPPQTVEAMLTVGGGEPSDTSWLRD